MDYFSFQLSRFMTFVLVMSRAPSQNIKYFDWLSPPHNTPNKFKLIYKIRPLKVVFSIMHYSYNLRNKY